MSKVCSKCGEIKSLDSFYKKPTTKDGHKARCKDCDKAYHRTAAAKEAHKAANKKYIQTEKGRAVARKSCANFRKTAAFKASIEKYRRLNPERRSAQTAICNALRSGRIHRPDSCSVCGVSCIPEGHHFDYSKPLDVIWVCKQCHTDYHWSKT